MGKWEYKAEKRVNDSISFKDLKMLGNEGWELCGVAALPLVSGGQGCYISYYFKRPCE